MSNATQPDLSRSVSATAPTCAATSGREIGLLLVLMLAVAAITFIVHRPVLDVQAISFDDRETFVENPVVQTPSWSSVKTFFTEVTDSSVVRGYYRPLTLTSLMLDYAMGGGAGNFRPFHRTSLALHLGSTMLVILLGYQLFGRPIIAALIGLLFGLHPLTVEPIAWVMERKTILAAFFAFACLCAYVRYAHSGRWRWFVFAVLLYLLSLLAKPTGTPLPIMMLLIDYWPLKRLGVRAVFEKVPFLGLAVLFSVLAYLCEDRVNPLKLPIAEFPLRACWLVVFYLGKIVMPIHLSSVYMLPDPLKITNPAVLASVAGTIAIVAALAVSRRWTPALWVGAAVFFIGLGPTMGLVHYSWIVASDKYVYLPAIGLILILGWLLTALWSPGRSGFLVALRRVAVVAAVLVAACPLAAATRRYLPEWKTSESLNAYMLKLAPKSGPVNYDVGSLLLEQARLNPEALDQAVLDKAFDYYLKASRLDTNFAAPHYGMGWIFSVRGKYDDAIKEYNLALEHKKDYAKAHVALAQAYVNTNQPDKAIETLRQLTKLHPKLAIGHQMLAALLVRGGQAGDAVAELTRTASDAPDNADLALSLADTLMRAGKTSEAIDRYNQVLRITPDSAIVHYRLGNALAMTGRTADAVTHYAEALRLAPDRPAVMNALAWTLATSNIKPPPGTPPAVQLAEEACNQTQHREPNYLDTLAAAYARDGRFKEAERTASEAIDLATSMNQYTLVRAIDARWHLYRSEQPYDESASIAAEAAAASTPAASTPAPPTSAPVP